MRSRSLRGNAKPVDRTPWTHDALCCSVLCCARSLFFARCLALGRLFACCALCATSILFTFLIFSYIYFLPFFFFFSFVFLFRLSLSLSFFFLSVVVLWLTSLKRRRRSSTPVLCRCWWTRWRPTSRYSPTAPLFSRLLNPNFSLDVMPYSGPDQRSK